MGKSFVASIQLRGVNVNNLKNIDVDFPHQQITTICGVSGSGKTSLALDTLHAEGQRRFISSFSTYARQFLDQIEKPNIESIENILPSVAVKAESGLPGRRTTVGSATEIVDNLRLIFAELASPVCDRCQVGAWEKSSPDSILRTIQQFPESAKYLIGFQVQAGSAKELSEKLVGYLQDGFARALVGDRIVDLRDSEAARADWKTGLIDLENDPPWIIVDRLTVVKSAAQRCLDSLELAMDSGSGKCEILLRTSPLPVTQSGPSLIKTRRLAGENWSWYRFGRHPECPQCGTRFSDPEPNLFNDNSSLGACSICRGTGIRGNPGKSSQADVDPCETCDGSRLNRDALQYQIDGQSIADLCQTPVIDFVKFLSNLAWNESQQQSVAFPLRQVQTRLQFLQDIGVGYLTLNRLVATLSQGENQRIRLASALGSDLINTVYILDEPTRGLHAENVGVLKTAIQKLSDRGNAVVLVDHQPEIVRMANQIIELGPMAGLDGGNIIFSGTPQEMLKGDQSLTGQFLSGKRGFVAEKRRPCGKRIIELESAHGNNLKQLTVQFPLGAFCVVTGVSGSGKSTLLCDTLFPAISQEFGVENVPPLAFEKLNGFDAIDEVVLIDGVSIGRSSRSNPVTYVKAFSEIRHLFASTVEAKTKNMKAGHFSFNVEGGRCSHCRGEGFLSVDMQFMPDVSLVCESCGGKRFREEVLQIQYRGKNILQVLEMSIREAFSFFRGQPKIQAKLNSLLEVGLGYLKLGQRANSLSNGESQRLKMAYYLGNVKQKRTLFIMDEPSNGLHAQDMIKLLDCFDGLIAIGHSIIAIEHNMNMIANADWVIDLGPGADRWGGQLVAEGTPETIADHPESVTGKHLRCFLEDFRN